MASRQQHNRKSRRTRRTSPRRTQRGLEGLKVGDLVRVRFTDRSRADGELDRFSVQDGEPGMTGISAAVSSSRLP
jgi:hypothetical protein